MADFCRSCGEYMFGPDMNDDLAGLCPPGYVVPVICEDCGYIWVDHDGHCQNHSENQHRAMRGQPIRSEDWTGRQPGQLGLWAWCAILLWYFLGP